jgi:hypothetical protein
VDFLCVGAAKSGTTWLSENLRQHPDIFIPPRKEIHYFNKFMSEAPEIDSVNYYEPTNWYHSFFKNAGSQQVCGELSVSYLYFENCAKDIFQYNPNMKIVAILRDPVERAISNYRFFIETGLLKKNTSFQEAVVAKPLLLERGLYFQQLKRYCDIFPKEQIKVFLYDDIKTRPKLLFKELLDVIGVCEYYPDTLERKINVTKKSRFRRLNYFMQSAKMFLRKRQKLRFVLYLLRISKIAALADAIINKEGATGKKTDCWVKVNEAEIRAYFKKDLDDLEKLLNKDLSHWK